MIRPSFIARWPWHSLSRAPYDSRVSPRKRVAEAARIRRGSRAFVPAPLGHDERDEGLVPLGDGRARPMGL
jgi:hypothetical protein